MVNMLGETMYKEIFLKDIKAKGWAREFLKNQANNYTYDIGDVAEPFSGNYWGNTNPKKACENDNIFVGGIPLKDLEWVPFEQTGYWVDAMVRVGHLIDDERILNRARSKIYPVLDTQDSDGFLGPWFLKNDTTWAHSIYFRSWMAEYSATMDKRLIDALSKHYKRKPLKEIYKEYTSSRLVAVRNVADIEGALWLFGITGDMDFLTMAEESYEAFNEHFSSDKGWPSNAWTREVIVKGMLKPYKVQHTHGVTYSEICKLSAILYMYTNKEVYKNAAVNAFDKVYRDQMLVDGCYSSTEYLNGNENTHACHETCDISDFTWALGYLYMITGDSKYGDWIEDAIFNAGFACVDDDFCANQYFSSPNQVVCDDTSNHAYFYKGADWNSYSPKNLLACCAGNVHRFMPNYVIRSWYKGDDGSISVLTYVPSSVRFDIDDKELHIDEITKYPFENKISFVFNSQTRVNLKIKFRIPKWAISATLKINGKVFNVENSAGFFNVHHDLGCGDIIEIVFEDKIEFIENAKGISVKKGPLLYALPVLEEKVIHGLKEKGNLKYPHYSLYPKSKWNYGLDISKLNEVKFIPAEFTGEKMWTRDNNGCKIIVPVKEVKNWKLIHYNDGLARFSARGQVEKIGHSFTVMGSVSDNIKQKDIGESTCVELVPYATTTLRVAIFPKL